MLHPFSAPAADWKSHKPDSTRACKGRLIHLSEAGHALCSSSPSQPSLPTLPVMSPVGTCASAAQRMPAW